jgi:tetratricopeptide (TPR) repeat protein
MNSPSVSFFPKTLLTILFVACLILTPSLARAQAQDYTEEEYKVFQDIQAEKDDVKKVDAIVKFLQEKPKNGLRQYMLPEYQKVIIELKNEKKWSQIITLGERFLTVAPGDDFTEGHLANACSESNNMRCFATYGERVYAAKPNADLARALAAAYQKQGNEAKALQWKEKVLASNPDDILIMADAMKRYAAAQNNAQAVKYAKQCLKVLPTAKKPEGTDAENWKVTVDQTYAIAYGVLGQDDYQNRRYSLAIKNLDNATKYFKRNDAAYFALGMCYWQTGKLDAAMLNFAKAYVIKGAAANSAKQNLDKLWKQSSKGATAAGLQRVIERAQQDLSR